MLKLNLALAAMTLCASGTYATEGPEAADATVKGSLDKEVIRRVIRQHIGEVKQCYVAELRNNNRLAGRVMVNFTIGPDGRVTESRVEQSTLGSPPCEKCIADAVHGWEFPKPRGGKVVVTYPFLLAATEPAAEPAGGAKQ